MQFDHFLSELTVKVPIEKKIISERLNSISDEDKAAINDYVNMLMNNGYGLAQIADCYKFIVDVTNREQLDYFRNMKGYNKSQAAVKREVYADADYMRKYMIGLAISMFIWKQHIELYHFFCESVRILKSKEKGVYLEIGAGHGLFGRFVIINELFKEYRFVDISETGLELTKEAIGAIKTSSSITYEVGDFMDYDGNRVDFICAGEVIEAVSDAGKFLNKCYDSLAMGGHMYLSTPINTAVPDTVTVFGSIEYLENLLEDTGFTIAKNIYLPYNNQSLEESIRKHMPVNVGYLLEKMD